jgi:ABC-type nitrate/sulfonate/bicarbonate transport system substrate-binding protein
MSTHSAARRSRREFLHGLTMAGMATLLGLRARPAAPEPPPETTTLTLAKVPSICSAPLAVAEELFKAEGFREVRFVKKTTVAESYEVLASAELHFNFQAIGGGHLPPTGCGRAGGRPRRGPYRVLRAVRHRSGPYRRGVERANRLPG